MSPPNPVLLFLRLLLLNTLVRPLSLLWPKDRNLIAFLPREGRRYIDNVAHFHANLAHLNLLPTGAYLLVTDRKIAKKWNSRGRVAHLFEPTQLKSLLLYLRTATIITDSWQWSKDGRFACFRGAKKIQIWHGIPLKQIERSNVQTRGSRGMIQRLREWTHGRYPRYDLVVSTSSFFRDAAFSHSFLSNQYVNTGYPRNDCLTSPEREPLVDGDNLTLRVLARMKSRGKRVVVYAPTFRDTGGSPFEDAALDLLELHEFARQNDLVVVVKFHPYVNDPPPTFLWPHVMAYDSSKDAAPLLRLTDLLITDYSSVYFDYLLLNRPIIFFPYDFEKYHKHDRAFLFDYHEYTPGPKVYDQANLFEALRQELAAPDERWHERRLRLRDLSFDHPTGNATLRLWQQVQALSRTSES